VMNEFTYSPSLTLTLTRACANKCLYCGFRAEGAGLISFEEIEAIVHRAHQENVSEVLVMSGEKSGRTTAVRDDLQALGVASVPEFAKMICTYLLDCDLLPHVNIGLLHRAEMAELKEVVTSMGLMMEGDYGTLGSLVHPGKDFHSRLENLSWAGELGIPFTTGILMGLGETREDRLASIAAIARVAEEWGHVQEIILQPYVPNSRSSYSASQVGYEEIKALVAYCRERVPEIHLQLPINLFSNYLEILELGFDDLGGISRNGDLINPEHAWPSITDLESRLDTRAWRLKKRLPVYREFYRAGWCPSRVAEVVETWAVKDESYQYYLQ